MPFLLTCLLTGVSGLMHIWYRGRTARTGESQPLLAETTTNTRPPIADSPAAWDLFFARTALATDMVFYALAFSARYQERFLLSRLGTLFGSHFGPVAHSVALATYARQPEGGRGNPHTGQLFGALGAVGTLRYVSSARANAVDGFLHRIARTWSDPSCSP